MILVERVTSSTYLFRKIKLASKALLNHCATVSVKVLHDHYQKWRDVDLHVF